MSPIQRLSQTLIDEVAAAARQSPRQRQNYNFHDHSERVQRFLNVMQPGTYVRPHRHRANPAMHRFECMLVLQGAIGVLILDDQGTVLETERLAAGGPVQGVELPPDTIHTLVALAPDTVCFEVKEGPYDAATDKEFLAQFPLEGDPACQTWLDTWMRYFQ